MVELGNCFMSLSENVIMGNSGGIFLCAMKSTTFPYICTLHFSICKITLGPIKMDNEVPTVTITLLTVVSSMQISNVGQMFRCKL